MVFTAAIEVLPKACGRIAVDEWRPSQNAYDWLGCGIYFWEDSRTRAEQWARQQFGDEAAVIKAEIELGDCVDLLQSTDHDLIEEAFYGIRAEYRGRGWQLPENRGGRHNLDCLVLNKFAELAARSGNAVQTMRGAFEEGRPLFPGSAIRRLAHVQIAVRDNTCIRLVED